MYIPPLNRENDPERSLRLIREFPFATLVTVKDGAPHVSHLPVLPVAASEGEFKSGTGKLKLIAHMSRHNPQWKDFAGSPVTVIFKGPDGYITPLWYETGDVPTWNYAVVHATGRAALIGGHRETLQTLVELVKKFEDKPDSWKFRLPDDLKNGADIAAAIVAFEIEVDEVLAKFKLGQNRSIADQRSVQRGLRSRGDARSLELAEWMLPLASESGSEGS